MVRLQSVPSLCDSRLTYTRGRLGEPHSARRALSAWTRRNGWLAFQGYRPLGPACIPVSRSIHSFPFDARVTTRLPAPRSPSWFGPHEVLGSAAFSHGWRLPACESLTLALRIQSPRPHSARRHASWTGGPVHSQACGRRGAPTPVLVSPYALIRRSEESEPIPV